MSHRPIQALLVSGILFGSWTASLSRAAEPASGEKTSAKTQTAGATRAVDVPLDRVVLFNSGVGYFDRRGEVQGDSQVELHFNVDDINDLLKSLVLQDADGGHVSAVNYGSKDPITKTLKKFAIDLTAKPTLGEILDQVRGEEVDVQAPNAIKGIILGVETREKAVGRDQQVTEVEMLNLLTDEGLRSVALDSVGGIRLLNEKLDKEFRQALKVLALGHDTDKKTVKLNFLGQGKRRVRVGYVQQMPIWKTSYRLVLKEDEAPFLQGWAIVENTTEEDWDKVKLTLISGRPISFVMDLYDPLYVQRPVVEPDLFAALRPQRYGQDLLFKANSGPMPAVPPQDGLPQSRSRSSSVQRGRYYRGGMMGRGMGGMGGGRASDSESDKKDELAAGESEDEVVGYANNLELAYDSSMSEAGEVGELFQYEITTPVSLPRQESAMLPIVNEKVKGKKLSIYNPAVQAKHPLNGLRLVNATDLHLMQGPITVFDGNVYAGDARIEDMQPGADRLISYAIDLDVEVAPEITGLPDQITKLRLAKGTLSVDRKNARSRKFTVKNSSKKTKTVLVEVPIEAGWKLVAPKEPAEKTRDAYRFAVDVAPGKPAMLEVLEEQPVSNEWAVTTLDDPTILFYANQTVTSDKQKAALKEVVERKTQLEKIVQTKHQLEQQVQVIVLEQDRIRQNMAQLDRNDGLYKRYVTKFGQQEDAVEKLRTQIQKQVEDETTQRRAFDEFLTGLDLD